MPAPETLPTFDDLPELAGLGLRHAWDVFGEGDVLGSINLVTPERVARAAASVTTGELVSLDLPLDVPDPPLFGRAPYEHVVIALSRNEMDDHLDGFYTQASTQWDSLNHVRCREHGYWGGRTQDPTAGDNGLGIHHWAEHGIAGRGLLVDVAGWLEGAGRAYDPLEAQTIAVADLQESMAAQGVVARGRRHPVHPDGVGRRLPAARRGGPEGLRGQGDLRRAARRRGHGPLPVERPPRRAVL